MNKLNTSVMIFFSPRLFKTIKNTISLYKTLLFIKSVFEIHNQWSRAGNVWSSRAEPLWFLRRPRDRGIRRWLKSLFYSAREASCGRYNTGTSFFFFPFFLFVCPQDDMSTIKQTIMCQYLSLLFSLFSVRLHFMWYSHPFPSPSITPPLRCVPVLCYRGGVLPSDSAPGHENVSVEKRGWWKH